MTPDVLVVVYRTVVFYFLLIAVVRMMGKREIASLAPSDLVVAILLADLAILPIESKQVSIWVGVVPIVVIAFLQIVLAYVSLKSKRAQRVLDGVPSILIRSGKIDMNALRSNRYALEELISGIRQKGFFDISDVEVAILESNGELSVLPKSQKRPVTPEDLGISTPYEGLPHVLIIDGQVQHKALEAIGKDVTWLEEELRNLGVVGGPESIVLASLNTEGQLFYQLKDS